MQYSDTDNVPY